MEDLVKQENLLYSEKKTQFSWIILPPIASLAKTENILFTCFTALTHKIITLSSVNVNLTVTNIMGKQMQFNDFDGLLPVTVRHKGKTWKKQVLKVSNSTEWLWF